MSESKQVSAVCDINDNQEWAVVMPAYNAEEIIGDCLDALIEAGFPPKTITVVDDGSVDRTSEIALQRHVNLLSNVSNQRPAQARNRGVAVAGGDIILFIDSDVCVNQDIFKRLTEHMSDPSVSGVIGSYDDAPQSKSTVGRYRNLLHAYTHKNSGGDVPTFWTGLGAIRREAFEKAGGFLSDWENIEDVELGLRVTENGGRIVLDPEINGKHLKDWSFGSMLMTDLFGRAVPWTRLLRSGRMKMGVLATAWDKRISAAAIALGGVCFLGGFVQPLFWVLFLIAALVFVGVNFGMLRYMMRSSGLWFALCCLPLHVTHHIAGLLGYAKVILFERKVGASDG